jgi:hypothetical protein
MYSQRKVNQAVLCHDAVPEIITPTHHCIRALAWCHGEKKKSLLL